MNNLELKHLCVQEVDAVEMVSLEGGWILGVGPLKWHPMVRAGMLSRTCIGFREGQAY